MQLNANKKIMLNSSLRRSPCTLELYLFLNPHNKFSCIRRVYGPVPKIGLNVVLKKYIKRAILVLIRSYKFYLLVCFRKITVILEIPNLNSLTNLHLPADVGVSLF